MRRSVCPSVLRSIGPSVIHFLDARKRLFSIALARIIHREYVINLVQESTFCAIMIRSTFYPNPISSKMMSRKFHPSSSMAYLHKCPLNYTLPYGRSNFQSDFFAILIADSDSLQNVGKESVFLFWIFLWEHLQNQEKLQETKLTLTYPQFLWFWSYLTHFLWEYWKKKDSFFRQVFARNLNLQSVAKKFTLKILPPIG